MDEVEKADDVQKVDEEFKARVLDIIREKMSIAIDVDTDWDWDRRYLKVTVSLLLDGTTIAEEYSSTSIGY